MNNTVLLIEPTIRPIGVEYLRKHCTIVMAPNGQEETIINTINKHKISSVIIRTERITRKIVESCPTLEVIGMHGVGLDNIDIPAATENGVMVLHAPFSNYTSVAEHSLMSILALSRNLLICDSKVRNNEWHYREVYYPMEINGKTLLIIGMGRIGQDLAKKAKAFNLTVLGYDPFVSKSEMQLSGVTKVEDLNTSLPICDFVSLHAPLTKSTHHLFSYEQFDLMKDSSFIINLSRGPLINEEALYKSLIEKKIAGAALDVLEHEPPKNGNPLFQLNNVIFTPHIGGDTAEAKDRCSEFITREVCRAIQGEIPNGLVNYNVIGNARVFKNKLKGVF